MEYLSQYKYTINYVKGEDNTVANTLSRMLSKEVPADTEVAAIFTIENDLQVFADIRRGYKEDKWCTAIINDLKWNMINSKLAITWKNGLLFMGGRLMVPKYKDLHEKLYRLVHDNLGHFGGEKSYSSLHNKFYWPNMQNDLLSAYIPGCVDCQ